VKQTIDTYIPVFKSKKTQRRVPMWHTLKMYSHINSVLHDSDFYNALKRKWDIYACYGTLMAQRVYLSHFECNTQDFPEEEANKSSFASVKISPVLDDRYQHIMSYKSKYVSLWLHYDKDDFAENFLMRAHHDLYHMHDCYVVLETGKRNGGLTTEIAEKRLCFFNVLYGGCDPIYSIDDYDIVVPPQKKTRKPKSNHYVYTLSHPVTRDILYVGYTTNPSMRYQSHLYSQTNPHLIKIMMTTEKPLKMDIIYKSDTYEDAYNYETEMILEYGKRYKLANIAKNPFASRPDNDIPFW